MKRIVVLISGRGSNMQAIVNACQTGRLDAQVVRVISNRPQAAGLQYAQKQNIETVVCDHTVLSNRDNFDAEIGKAIESANPDLVVLAGFMRILGAELVENFLGRIINIHPSLLPKYPGLNTHRRALAAGDTEHGASVHFVTPELDAGPIIAQAIVPIVQGDTEQSLAQRVLAEEHELLINSMHRCLTGDIQFEALLESED